MEALEQPCYSLISCPSYLEPPNEMQLKSDLEHGTKEIKIDTMKKIIRYISNGERLPGLLVPIIRFVLPSRNHTIKKLLLIYWEIVPKATADGKLLQEFILVCDAYRKDLEHANEFVRGSTLRFLSKLKEPELIEPILPAIRSCLKHRTSYVRRNAVLAIFTIYKNFEFLIPDAPELIEKFLIQEKDMSCKRNAFLMLLHTDLERALSFLLSCLDQVTSFGDILQLMVVQLMQKVCFENPSERSKFIRVIFSLLSSNSASVRYEAAGTLVTLSNAPTAIKAAASCYIDLIISESDNNAKFIILDRLILLKENPLHERVLQDLVMDILRILPCTDLEVKAKALDLTMDLANLQTIQNIIQIIQKEIKKVYQSFDTDDSGKYLQLLVKTLHFSCLKFPNISSAIVPFLMDCLTDSREYVCYDSIIFLREIIHRFEPLRSSILDKILQIFKSIKFMFVHRAVLWLLGEYSSSISYIERVLNEIKASLGPIPLYNDDRCKINNIRNNLNHNVTYSYSNNFLEQSYPPLRQYLLEGDFLIGSTVALTLAKLAIRYTLITKQEKLSNKFVSECMLIISAIINFGKTDVPNKPMSCDTKDILLLSLRILSQPNNCTINIFTKSCRRAISHMLSSQDNERYSALISKKKSKYAIQVDDPLMFSQLTSSVKIEPDVENLHDLSLSRAIKGQKPVEDREEFSSSEILFNRVSQLTGFSDPVYAEAHVHPNQYDIVLEIFLVNQSQDLLQNCTVELATLGDLKLVEKPQQCILGPQDFCRITAVIKVSSTENGIIFGNIVYDIGGTADKNVIILNDIHIDFMDYIIPSTCTDSEFRKMWAEFEWENKVSVNLGINDMRKYLNHFIRSTNMKCLTPEKALCGECEYLAANLFARSIFGEDALVNVSLEKRNEPKSVIAGHIRIRAKSQGMALYLGEIINKAQKETSVFPIN